MYNSFDMKKHMVPPMIFTKKSHGPPYDLLPKNHMVPPMIFYQKIHMVPPLKSCRFEYDIAYLQLNY